MDPAADLSLTTGLARDPPLRASCGCGLVDINIKLPASSSLSIAVAGFFCDARAPSPAFFPMVGSCVLHEFELCFLFWRPFFAVTSSHPPRCVIGTCGPLHRHTCARIAGKSLVTDEAVYIMSRIGARLGCRVAWGRGQQGARGQPGAPTTMKFCVATM